MNGIGDQGFEVNEMFGMCLKRYGECFHAGRSLKADEIATC